jgi:hypothetical protein
MARRVNLINGLETMGNERIKMKLASWMFLAGLCASASFAQNTTVRWGNIVGVITAPGVDNIVGGTVDSNGIGRNQIHSGTSPWTTRDGGAHVNLSTGEGAFHVEGLVLIGGSASGTPGPVNSVVGTLVCNPGAPSQTVIDTPSAALSPLGNAELAFRLRGLSWTCGSPIFLIRIPQFGLRWIATGVLPVGSSTTDY